MKKSILFVNDEMTMGGVARILNNLLSKLDKDKFDIDLLVLHPHGDLMSEIPSHVNVLNSSSFFKGIDVNLNEAIKNFNLMNLLYKMRVVFYMKTGLIKGKLLKERKKLLKKNYDVEFSAKEGFCTIFVSVGNTKRKLNWVQVDYGQQNYSKNHMPLMIETLKNIDMNIACSKEVSDSYQSIFETKQVKVINNFIDDIKISKLANQKCDIEFDPAYVNFITVARFHPQKSVDRLITAFSNVHKQFDKTRLYIIGDGDLKPELVKQVDKLQISHVVFFLGLKSNPYPYIKQADVFILSSLYEGYPTIVIESFISGTPVLSTKVAGVSDQINENQNGWIVENSIKGMEDGIKRLLLDPSLIEHAKKNLISYKYPNKEILKAIEDEINQ